MIDRDQLGNGVFIALTAQCSSLAFHLIASSAIAQTDEDGRLSALDGEVGDADILQCATIDNLQRDSRRSYPLTEEFLPLVLDRLYHDAADIDVAEATVGLGAQFHGVAVAADYTVGDADIFAESGRS